MSQAVAVRQVPGGRMSTIVYDDLGEEVRRDAGIRGSRATPHLAPRCLPSAQRMTDRPSNMFLRSAGAAVMLGDVLACPGNVEYLVLAPPICCLVFGAPHPVLGRHSSCRTLRWQGLELNVAYATGLKVARSLAAAAVMAGDIVDQTARPWQAARRLRRLLIKAQEPWRSGQPGRMQMRNALVGLLPWTQSVRGAAQPRHFGTGLSRKSICGWLSLSTTPAGPCCFSGSGSRVLRPLLGRGSVPTPRLLRSRRAGPRQYRYPDIFDPTDLARVAQYLSIDVDGMWPKHLLLRRFAATLGPRLPGSIRAAPPAGRRALRDVRHDQLRQLHV